MILSSMLQSATVFLLKITYYLTNNSFWSLGSFIHRSRRYNNKSEHFQALIPEVFHRLPAFILHFLHLNGISMASQRFLQTNSCWKTTQNDLTDCLKLTLKWSHSKDDSVMCPHIIQSISPIFQWKCIILLLQQLHVIFCFACSAAEYSTYTAFNFHSLDPETPSLNIQMAR